jgi:SET domain-containing protein
MANHSCTPNAVQSFEDNGRISFRAIAPISPGQEVTISYIELAAARPERREALLASYFFDIDEVCCMSTWHVKSPRWCGIG